MYIGANKMIKCTDAQFDMLEEQAEYYDVDLEELAIDWYCDKTTNGALVLDQGEQFLIIEKDGSMWLTEHYLDLVG